MPADLAVTKLTIEGYKSIRSLVDFPLSSINVLIGANGAGKSNLLGFFGLVDAVVRARLEVSTDIAGGADRLLHLGAKITRQINGRIDSAGQWLEFTLYPTADNQLAIGMMHARTARSDGDAAGSGSKHDANGLHATAGYGAVGSDPGSVARLMSRWKIYHFGDTSGTAGVRREDTVRNDFALAPDASNLAAFLMRLRGSRHPAFDRIRDVVRLVAPFFDDFLLRPRARGGDEVVLLEWTQRGSDYPFHPSQLSDGTLRFICLATALLQPEPPATILIDEPELGLHPYALELVAEMVRQAATRTQVIVSTQSPTLLNHFEPDDVIVVDRKDGQSTFNRLDPGSLKAWLTDFTLGELWQKNTLSGVPAHEWGGCAG